MKKMSREEIRALVLREAKKILSEKTDPRTLKVNPDDQTFTVDAIADKPGEGGYGKKKNIKGRYELYNGEFLPKAIPGEDYFDPNYSPRQASAQLSNQLKNELNTRLRGKLEAIGMSKPQAQRVVTQVGRTKSQIFDQALSAVAAVAAALPSDANGTQAKRILVKAILDIANVSLGFPVATPDLPELDDESYIDDQDRADLY